MKINKKLVVYGILLIIFVLGIIPWMKEGVPGTDDYRHHATRLWFVKQQITSFEFSEWMPNIYGGWPFLHFYHPAFYILSIPVAMISDPVVALKIMTCIIYALALFGTFYAGKLLFKDEDIALVGAVAYFMSSHFLFHATVSGALPRLTAIALVPLVSAMFIKALEEHKKKFIIAAAVLLAILLMMHTSIAIPVFIICGIYLLYELYSKKNIKSLKPAAIIFVIAIALCAAWIIPLILEKNYASLPENLKLESVSLSSIEQSLRTFGITHNGEHYVRSNYFGYLTFALSLIGLFFIRKNREVNMFKIGLIASIVFYFNLFGILDYIPMMNVALTGSTGFFITTIVSNIVMLAAVGAKSLAKKFKKDYLVYIIVILIAIELYPALNAFSYGWVNQETKDFTNPPQLIDAWDFIKNQEGNFVVFSAIGQSAEIYHQKQEFGFDWVGCPQCVQKKTYAVHNQIWENFTKGIKDDEVLGYLGVKYYVIPCQTKLENKIAYSNGAVCVYENEKFKPLVDSTAKISNVKYTLDSVSFNTLSDKETTAIIKINYFKPHWHAYVNGKETEISTAWPEFMQITIPSGNNNVSIEYKTNSLHIISWLITILTIILGVYYIRK